MLFTTCCRSDRNTQRNVQVGAQAGDLEHRLYLTLQFLDFASVAMHQQDIAGCAFANTLHNPVTVGVTTEAGIGPFSRNLVDMAVELYSTLPFLQLKAHGTC